MHEIVDDLAELADGAALADEIAGRSVERHHAVPDTPAPLSFGIQPDDTFHALAHHPERPRLGVVVVVASVAEEEDGRAAIQRIQLPPHELAERVAEVGATVVVHRRRLQRPLDGPLDRIRAEGLGHLGDLRHEDERAHAAEAFLQAPHELQHEPRGVAHRVRHVAHGDELRLVTVTPAQADLHGDAVVLEALADGPPGVDASALFLPLTQGQRVLDLASQPGHRGLHLGDFVGGQREQRLVAERLALELFTLAPGSALQLALDVLANHPAKGLQPQLEVVADARELTGIEAARFEPAHDLGKIPLDGAEVEPVLDAPRGKADLQAVHQALEADLAAARANGHLHLGAATAEEQLAQVVELERILGDQPVDEVLHARVLRPQGLAQSLAEGLKVEEIQIEDAIERVAVAAFLDERRGQRGLERLAIVETDLGRSREGVQRLRWGDADLGASEIADELQDTLVQRLLREHLVERAAHALEVLFVLHEHGQR